MTTIRDVAKLAGVAPITVSRVINNTSYVSQETRERVQAAIAELDYVPNMLGPSLRFKKTMTLAAIITDITNSFWTTVTRGIEDVAQANGYSVILCNTDESETKQNQYVQMLLRRRVDGILLVPACNNSEPIRLTQKQGIPVVVMDRHIQDVEVDIVRGDSEGGAYQLTQHLIALGHRRIAILAGPQNVSTSVDRVKGYCRALIEAGFEESDTRIVWGNYTRESGNEMTEGILSKAPRPTALFAANNFIAIGAMQSLKENGLQVPDDMAIVAFDGIPPAITNQPFLTVATQPAKEMGYQATQLLLERIKDTLDSPYQHIVLPTQIIIRESSGESIVV